MLDVNLDIRNVKFTWFIFIEFIVFTGAESSNVANKLWMLYTCNKKTILWFISIENLIN